MKLSFKLLSYVLIFSLFFTVSASVSFAKGGDGSGGGNGGNKGLTLQKSSPKDKQDNIPVNSSVTLTFTNNVVNMSVADKNKNSITMQDENGKPVAVKIIMADDQVSPEKKREIKIVPRKPLKKSETYYIKVDKNLQAKNGIKLGKPIQISFTTAGEVISSNNSSKQSITVISVIVILIISGLLLLTRKTKLQKK